MEECSGMEGDGMGEEGGRTGRLLLPLVVLRGDFMNFHLTSNAFRSMEKTR